jgi:hypothetical protein
MDQHLINQQMAEPAVSSDSEISDTCFRQDSELRELAYRLWMHSQALNISVGYTRVEGMIANNDKLALRVQVKMQAKLLEILQEMEEELPGHAQGSLECRDGGVPHATTDHRIAGDRSTEMCTFTFSFLQYSASTYQLNPEK